MSDSEVLSRYVERVAAGRSEVEARATEEAWNDYGCLGWLRGQHERAVMLELRKRSGNVLAIGYGWLERAEFDPSLGITLHIVGQTIRIRGRNLNSEVRPLVRLFEGITRHRVPWVAESERMEELHASVAAIVVETIDW